MPPPEEASSSTSAPSTPQNQDRRYHNLDTAVKQPRKFRRSYSSEDNACTNVLRQVFRKIDFKGKQKEIVHAAMQGVDIFVSAPTGMGKSICFQVPAVADEDGGVTIVVSPLLALMHDQVSKLRDFGVLATSWTSETSPQDRRDIIAELCSEDPMYRLLYITPEKLMTKEMTNILKLMYRNGRLNRLVVDEAHCISEWGHDFREEYRMLGKFRDRFPETPITALTASATPAVRHDIVNSLKLSGPHLFSVIHPFNRENLFYEIRHLPFIEQSRQFELIYDYIHKLSDRRGMSSSGIIYARTRAICDDLSLYLRNNGIAARPYHRGIPSSRLSSTLSEWLKGEGCDVVCCTIAFGMGIDKPDVRYVIHYDVPKSFEGYYQETGRAGRDGLPAKCILYYSREDAMKAKFFVKKSQSTRLSKTNIEPSQRAPRSITELIAYAENAETCRHILICRYFGEIIDERDQALRKVYCDGMCDICKNPEKVRSRKQELSNEQWVLSQLSHVEKELSTEDAEDEPSSRHGPPARQPTKYPGLGRPVLKPFRSHSLSTESPASGSGESVQFSRSDRREDTLFPPKQRPNRNGKDPFGRKKYDGPILRNGLIENNREDDDAPIPMHGVIRQRAASDDESSASIPAPKRARQLGNAHHEQAYPLIPQSGRRISSGATFKTPFRKGFDPLAPPPRPPPEAPAPRRRSPSPKRREVVNVEDENDEDSDQIPTEVSDDSKDSDDSDAEDAHLASDEALHIFNQLPTLLCEYSDKISLSTRSDGFTSILYALRRAFFNWSGRDQLWVKVEGLERKLDFLADTDRARILVKCALKVECNAMSYSTRPERYSQNLRMRLKAIRYLRKGLLEGEEVGEEPASSRSETSQNEATTELWKEMRRASQSI